MSENEKIPTENETAENDPEVVAHSGEETPGGCVGVHWDN